jgi:hypothetical protein
MFINFGTTAHLDDIYNDSGIQQYGGSISDYDDAEKEIRIGEIEAYIIDQSTATEEDADSVDGSVYDVFCFLDKHDFLEGLVEGFGRILFIDTMKIFNKEYRKRNIGLNAMYQTCKVLGANCSCAIILPCPLYPDFGPEERELGRKKLQKYWAKLGFRRIKRSDYFFLDLAYELKKPQPVVNELPVVNVVKE